MVGPLFVSEKSSYALPAAMPPEEALAFNTPVEHLGSSVLVVVDGALVLDVVEFGDVVDVVGEEEPKPQPTATVPAAKSASSFKAKRPPTDKPRRDLTGTSSHHRGGYKWQKAATGLYSVGLLRELVGARSRGQTRPPGSGSGALRR